ncbi:histidine kinase [Capnocytophaga sp. ARDL2]|uniref:histidine kinase n=1 Tax=Capnocytophaga sp. ARDL2 TaxID=3238809 RepID=UPI0035567F04
MRVLRAQMNPHFIFNSLNSINSYIIQHKTDDASKYLGVFFRLIRNILEGSKQKMIPLTQELQTIKMYLQLEAMCLEYAFDFELIVDEAIDTDEVQIPRLLIQPFAKNSI